MLYEVGSVYGRMLKLSDVRKARGKLYRLEDVLMIDRVGQIVWGRSAIGDCGVGEESPRGISSITPLEPTCISQSQHVSSDPGVRCVSRRNRTTGGRI